MKILGTICARGGSKGVKNKNIRDLNGKPLISHTIDFFKKWGNIDRLVVSTDSQKIAEVAKQYGADVPILRPKELASDYAFKLDAIKHIVEFCENEKEEKYDIIIDLDPTAPLRKQRYLDEAFDKFLKSEANNLYSVCKSHKNPYFNMVELDEKGYAHLSKHSTAVARQKAPEVYSINASIYIYNRDFLIEKTILHSDKTIVYEMPEIASVDIDREIDFLFIEFLLRNNLFEFD